MYNNSQDILVRELDSRVYLVCKSYNLVVEGTDLSLAYSELKRQRENLIARFNKVGLDPLLSNQEFSEISSKYRSKSPSSQVVNQWLPLVMSILFCFILVVLSVTLYKIQSISRHYVANFHNKMNSTYLLNSISDFSNRLKEVTPGKREEIHERLQTFVQELQPFVDDLRPLLDSQDKQPMHSVNKSQED